MLLGAPTFLPPWLSLVGGLVATPTWVNHDVGMITRPTIAGLPEEADTTSWGAEPQVDYYAEYHIERCQRQYHVGYHTINVAHTLCDCDLDGQ
jgi:hypothetical protein